MSPCPFPTTVTITPRAPQYILPFIVVLNILHQHSVPLPLKPLCSFFARFLNFFRRLPDLYFGGLFTDYQSSLCGGDLFLRKFQGFCAGVSSNNCSTWQNINHCSIATFVSSEMALHILYRDLFEIWLSDHRCPMIVFSCLQWQASSLFVAAFGAIKENTRLCLLVPTAVIVAKNCELTTTYRA